MESDKEARILEAARSVFFRYGFRRVTMGDIAEASGISRPALYLIFPNKEVIFEAVARQVSADALAEIRAGIGGLRSLRERLDRAFEIWAVRPFEWMQASPDARDLTDCTLGFAEAATRERYAAFERALAAIIEPAIADPAALDPPLADLVHMLAVAVRGFKTTARDAAELRQLIGGLLSVTLAALNL
jgi:AcrR family transcriptional regulator